MASDRIEELKTVKFQTERRGGYDHRAVDAYLAELADWLETGGEDEARRAVIQRAMADVGERTGSILASAQESADRLMAEAEAEAARIRAEAEQHSEKARSEAEHAAAKTRADADAYASETREAADEHARVTAETAAAEAKAKLEEADAKLERAEAEAAERTRGIEQEIAELVRKRRDVVANLEQLNAEMRLAIEGPGERDLDLPERVEAAVDSLPAAARKPAPAATENDADPGEAPTTVSEVADRPTGEPDTDEREPDTDEREPDTDEREEPDTDEHERRRRSVESVEDPPSDETKLTELL